MTLNQLFSFVIRLSVPVFSVGCCIITLKLGCLISKFPMKVHSRIISCGGARKHKRAKRLTNDAINISGKCLYHQRNYLQNLSLLCSVRIPSSKDQRLVLTLNSGKCCLERTAWSYTLRRILMDGKTSTVWRKCLDTP